MTENFVTENFRKVPELDELGFDPRLMTAERLLKLAGKIRLRYALTRQVASLDCAVCGRAVEILTDETGKPYLTTPLQILTGALRHEVMRHDLALSGETR